ncbi:hypothetical protein PAV_10c02150 [Paenibacillus alvei DSM 29]|nr:hypothetical protein PAV_10c02150 [Paenibacillus alvei DSM 29]
MSKHVANILGQGISPQAFIDSMQKTRKPSFPGMISLLGQVKRKRSFSSHSNIVMISAVLSWRQIGVAM